MNMQEDETIIRTLCENIGAPPDNYVDLKKRCNTRPDTSRRKSRLPANIDKKEKTKQKKAS